MAMAASPGKKRPLGPNNGLIRTPRTPRRRKALRSGLPPSPFTSPVRPRRAQSSQKSLYTPPGYSKSPGRPHSAGPARRKQLALTPGSDRFIPARGDGQLERSYFRMHEGGARQDGEQMDLEAERETTPTRPEHRDCEQMSLQARFHSALRETLLDMPTNENTDPDRGTTAPSPSASRVLDFSGRTDEDLVLNPFRQVLQVLPQDLTSATAQAAVASRHISPTPTRILDAPDLVDDYYLNLIHWGQSNILAVALGPSVYLWDAASSTINHLVQLESPSDFVTSVRWCPDGRAIAVGCNCSQVRVYDAEALTLTKTFSSHQARVGSLSWNGETTITSGSRDASIVSHDLRARDSLVARYEGHTQEVCGLRWNDDGVALASGGNENFLCLWDRRASVGRLVAPRLVLRQHQAAVKALAWAPFSRHVLASGGGTADRTIKIWNASTGACQQSVDTGSQVCSILWSPHAKELCSSHGFSEHQLVLWKFPTMTRVKELKGHTARVLHMAVSPDGRTVISAAADETLRFWDVFGPPPSASRSSATGFSFGVGGKGLGPFTLR